GTDPGRSQRVGTAHAGTARGGGAEDLPRLQIRGNVRDFGLPGFHRQIPFVYRFGIIESGAGAGKERRIMSCSPFDLNEYYLDELTGPGRRQVEAHMKTCAACREELDRLRIMGAALHSVPDQEIPQRIAFVSDKIFEPSPWRRRLA